MSSGYNGIPIREVGKTRIKLAKLIEKLTGCLVEPHRILRTNPYHRKWEDCCAWDCWATRPGAQPQMVHIYSWDTMTECVQRGIVLVYAPDHHSYDKFDMEVCVNEPK